MSGQRGENTCNAAFPLKFARSDLRVSRRPQSWSRSQRCPARPHPTAAEQTARLHPRERSRHPLESMDVRRVQRTHPLPHEQLRLFTSFQTVKNPGAVTRLLWACVTYRCQAAAAEQRLCANATAAPEPPALRSPSRVDPRTPDTHQGESIPVPRVKCRFHLIYPHHNPPGHFLNFVM